MLRERSSGRIIEAPTGLRGAGAGSRPRTRDGRGRPSPPRRRAPQSWLDPGASVSWPSGVDARTPWPAPAPWSPRSGSNEPRGCSALRPRPDLGGVLKNWLPFVDTYRTLYLTTPRDVQRVF